MKFSGTDLAIVVIAWCLVLLTAVPMWASSQLSDLVAQAVPQFSWGEFLEQMAATITSMTIIGYTVSKLVLEPMFERKLNEFMEKAEERFADGDATRRELDQLWREVRE